MPHDPMIHALDAATSRQTPSDGSPFTYYRQSCMLAHAGQLYHLTNDSVLDHNARYMAVLDAYVDVELGRPVVRINVRRIFLIKCDAVYGLTDDFASYKNYVQSSASDSIVYVIHAVQRLQRFWRGVLSCRVMRKYELLCMDAVCTSRLKQHQTWLQRLPVDILRLIRDEGMAPLH